MVDIRTDALVIVVVVVLVCSGQPMNIDREVDRECSTLCLNKLVCAATKPQWTTLGLKQRPVIITANHILALLKPQIVPIGQFHT